MLKHNSYFEGAVQSLGYTLDGRRQTVGVMLPQAFHFSTAAAERMTVIAGTLRAKLPGGDWISFPAGSSFEIPANSEFDVEALEGPSAYLCEFLD